MFNKSKEKIHALQEKIKKLEEEQKELKDILYARNSVSFLLEESIPKEQNERKTYMGDIALFYISIFKEKLKHFVGLQMQELSQVGREEKVNEIFRSNINCFNLISEWMEERTKEHLGNLEVMRNSFDEDDKFINNFKETYDKN